MGKILIIEDEPNIAKAEGLILGEDHSVHFAEDGEEGLKKVKELKPDLVILDLMLPKKGGYDVCFNIRQDPELKDTKVVMVTAKNQPLDEDKGRFIGADDYLKKPFEPEELKQIVSQALRK
ncbi:MAG: response regulator [Nanoarchaeota archaeon]|nr:response regulator [Nanoarchaeota archaeon]